MAVAKVMVSFPEPFLAEVDRIAHQERRSRSELLRMAMHLYIETQRKRRAPGLDTRVRAAVAQQDALARRSPGAGEDSSEEIRRWRDSRA